MNLWAVIPSRDRPEMLAGLVSALIQDHVQPVVVDTGYPDHGTFDSRVFVIKDHDEPLNISRWWNRGLRYIQKIEGDSEYTVAVLNDDLKIPARFVSQLANALDVTGGAAAYPDQHGYGQTFKHEYAGPISLYRRMTGYAFALRGSAGILADERMAWWYGDDDIDWRARQLGGSVLVGGLTVTHLKPNETTVGALAEQAGRDRETFIKKWGRAPW